MRWLVEVTSLGHPNTTESVQVDADTWQKALLMVRGARGEPESLGGFSIEVREDGWRAVEPTWRARYDVRLLAAGADAAATAKPAAVAPVQSPMTRTVAVSGAVPAPVTTVSVFPPRPSAPPSMPARSPLAPPVSAAGPPGSVPSQIIYKREHDRTAAQPLTYREYVYLVPSGTSDHAAEVLLEQQFELVRLSLDPLPAGKFVNLAAFDLLFQGKPPVRPLATLEWKDWRGPARIDHPRRGEKAPPDPRDETHRGPGPSMTPDPRAAVSTDPPERVPTDAPVLISPDPRGGMPSDPHAAAKAGDGARVTETSSNEPEAEVRDFSWSSVDLAHDAAEASNGVVAEPSAAGIAHGTRMASEAELTRPPVDIDTASDAPSTESDAQTAASTAPTNAAASIDPTNAAASIDPTNPAADPTNPAASTDPTNASTDTSGDPAHKPSAGGEPTASAGSAEKARSGSNDEVVRRDSYGGRAADSEGRAKTAVDSRPSYPSLDPRIRVRGDDLITDLFEAMHHLHFLRDAVDGGAFCLALSMEKIPCRAGVVYLYDIDHREFLVTNTRGRSMSHLLLKRYPESDPLISKATRRRRAVVIANASDSGLGSLGRYETMGGARSVLVVPVMQAGRFLGAIELVNPLDGQPFTESDGDAMGYIAEQFADFVAIRGAVTDPERITHHKA